MSKYLDEARRLRAIETPHHNCCQTLVMAFAEEAGLDPQIAFRLCGNFGKGMKRSTATCGAVSGALAVLALFGLDDQETVDEFYDAFRQKHDGLLLCSDLLAKNEAGENLERHVHCNGVIFDAVDIVEDMLRRKGKI